MLQDDSPLVRVAAAECLYQLGEVDRARRALVDALADPTPFVRLRAINVLYRMGAAAAPAAPAAPAIKQASLRGIYPAEYVNRMCEYLPVKLAGEETAVGNK
jgi:HEAT repeat protein